jgi:hypothetical protein
MLYLSCLPSPTAYKEASRNIKYIKTLVLEQINYFDESATFSVCLPILVIFSYSLAIINTERLKLAYREEEKNRREFATNIVYGSKHQLLHKCYCGVLFYYSLYANSKTNFTNKAVSA